MKSIPNISITEEEYLGLKKREVNSGGEGIICRGEDASLYKLFVEPRRRKLCPMSDNKLKKIVELYQNPLEYSVEPLSTISCNDEVVGYTMSYDPNDISLAELSTVSRKRMIQILREARSILEYYASRDVTYGDVTSRNILFNIKTGKVKFCDIDNIRLKGYPIDIKGYALNRYYSQTGIIDAKADAFMHNLLTMKKLHFTYPHIYESDILQALSRGVYPTKFKKSARSIFESMTEPEIFTGEYVIDHIKR